jgi:hypothetical protein
MSINVQVSTTPNVQIVAFPNIQVSTSPNIQVSGSANVQVLVENSGNLLNLTSLGHNDLLGLQGGQNNQYYHLNSGQYVGLNNIISSTGSYTLRSETGAFYAASNPSGFITGVNLSSYVTNSQTGAFYSASNPSGFITGVDNLVYTLGDQSISGIKTFNQSPSVPLIPTVATHASSKGYVDTTIQSAVSSQVQSDISGLTGATALSNIVQITQAGYNAIDTPLTNTLYIIVG